MLVYSKTRYLPTIPNTIVLRDDDGGYYYCHRDLYDKAVILEDKYSVEALESYFADKTNANIVYELESALPRPLQILAPFIYLVHTPIEYDLENCCGILHVISAAINVREFTRIDKALRNEVSFSLSVREEYELSWERFFETSIPYDERNTHSIISGSEQFVAPSPNDDIADDGYAHDKFTQNSDGTWSIEEAEDDPEEMAMLLGDLTPKEPETQETDDDSNESEESEVLKQLFNRREQ